VHSHAIQKEPYTHTQTHRAYKELQVSPFNLTVNVGNDKLIIHFVQFHTD